MTPSKLTFNPSSGLISTPTQSTVTPPPTVLSTVVYTSTLTPTRMIDFFFLNNYVLKEERRINEYDIQLWYDAQIDHPYFSIITISKDTSQEKVWIEETPKLNDLTGTDITGEGDPDVIISTYTGGAYGAVGTFVYNLGSTLTKVMEAKPTYNDCERRFQDFDGDGISEFVTCDDYFRSRYCWRGPTTRVIFQYDPNQTFYFPASPRFAELYKDDIATHLQRAEKVTAEDLISMGEDGVKCSVLAVVLDYLYSGQIDKGWSELKRLYPGNDVEAFHTEIEEGLKKSSLFVFPDEIKDK